ncbi:translocation protein TolB [Neobacillus sp. Marseille-QA0830]
MIRKIMIILFIGVLLPIYEPIHAETSDKGPKAAFIRNNDLWIKKGNAEQQVTNGGYIRYPKWSHDGKWVAYQKGKEVENGYGELWVYHLKERKHFQIHPNTRSNFQWSPNKNILGFMVNQTLNVVTAQLPKPLRAQQMAGKLDNFSWLPKGNGLLVSKKESSELHSDILLLKIYMYRKPSIEHFYRIPVGKNEYYVGTSPFKWSQDQKWISFLLTPTASLSADGNTLCLLSDNRRVFHRVDEMLNYPDWFRWAPSQNLVGYIRGTGREATSNKQAAVLSAASLHKKGMTPNGFVDRDLTWANNQTLFVSRSKASEWTKLKDRPLPRLIKINIHTMEQKPITSPAKDEGDFAPDNDHNQLYWIRTNRETAYVYVTRLDQLKERQWIKNINIGSYYYERWNWEEVFSLYTGEN